MGQNWPINVLSRRNSRHCFIFLCRAQEALEARRRQQQESESAESRKLVFDAKSGKFVPVKGKGTKKGGGGQSKLRVVSAVC